jgi:predicted membrane chloride channel (bestrophin family)
VLLQHRCTRTPHIGDVLCCVLQTYVGIVATMVCCYEAMLEKQLLPDWGFDWPGLAVSTTGVYSLSTFALSLLLVFRTNSSYQRYGVDRAAGRRNVLRALEKLRSLILAAPHAEALHVVRSSLAAQQVRV